MHDTPGRRCASRHCVVAHGRWSRQIGQFGVRSRASNDLERKKGQSPRVPRTKGASRTAGGSNIWTRWLPCRRLSEQIWFRAGFDIAAANAVSWQSPVRSPTNIAGVQIAPLLAVVPVTPTAFIQNGVIVPSEYVSQPPSFRYCDDPFEFALDAAIRVADRAGSGSLRCDGH
jgi:hypothetical protein